MTEKAMADDRWPLAEIEAPFLLNLTRTHIFSWYRLV